MSMLRSSTFRRAAIAIAICGAAASRTPTLQAADQWIEVKSAHFVVTSNASQSSARTLAWQLEQIRSAVAALWPWARPDLDRPLAVLALKDEATMKALAPGFWEEKGSVHPTSVWISAADQYYLAIRTDVPVEDKQNINPYITSYFAYVSLILAQSAGHSLPMWFSRGLAGVLSNTIVRDTQLLLGPPIPWHLSRLRQGTRLPVAALLKVTGGSTEFRGDEGMLRFDAEAWALVHFLMFGDSGARAANLDQFAKRVSAGSDADVAFREFLGPPEDLDEPLILYIKRSLFSFKQVNVDVSVKREGFTVRTLPVSESASVRALFYAATNRPAESRTAIAEARKGTPAPPESFVAEALLLEREGKTEEAQAAYARAVEAGSTSAHAYYRLAQLLWRPQPDHDTLTQIEKLLAQAMALNNRHAAAYAYFGEVRSLLGSDESLGYVRRAIALDPSDPNHRLTAARVLWRAHKYDEALKEARAALALAKTDEERSRARELADSIERAKGGATGILPAASR